MTLSIRATSAVVLAGLVLACGSDRNDPSTSSTTSALTWPANMVLPQGPILGSLPGEGHVTPAGSYEYTMPIEVPVGRAGMQPNLSLIYSNGNRDASLGIGWQLSGISAIKPCALTFATDGLARGISLQSSKDGHCWDGQKLVPLPGQSAPPAEFRTEEDVFAKIVATYSGADIASYRVWRKDGRILDFAGTIAGTSLADMYLLTAETDRFGNKISYEYTVVSPGEYYPSAIFYTGRTSDGSKGERSIVFNYQAGGDTPYFWINGVNFPIKRHLTAIVCYAPNPTTTQVVWTYTLYYTNNKAGRYLLDSIDRTGQLGGRSLKKQFKWYSAQGPGYFDYGSVWYAGSQYGSGLWDATLTNLIFDVNGDGRDDIVEQLSPPVFAQGNQQQTIYRSSPIGATPVQMTSTALPGLNDFKLRPDTRVADVDGDGQLDVVTLAFTDASHALVPWYDYLEDSDANPLPGFDTIFVVTHLTATPSQAFMVGDLPLVRIPARATVGPNEPLYVNRLLLSDLDGDGLQDILTGAFDAQSLNVSNLAIPATPLNWSIRRNTSLGMGTLGSFGSSQPVISSSWFAPGDEVWTYPPIDQAGATAPELVENSGGGRTVVYLAGKTTSTTEPKMFGPGEIDPGTGEENGYIGVALDDAGLIPVVESLFAPAPNAKTKIALADLNGDNNQDTVFITPGANDTASLCVQWGSVGSFFGTCAGPQGTLATQSGFWSGQYQTLAFDTDGDGRQQLYLVHLGPNGLPDGLAYEIWMDFQGGVSSKILTTAGGGVVPWAVGDFDGDGLVDVLGLIPGNFNQAEMFAATQRTEDVMVGVKDAGQSHEAETITYGRQWWAGETTIGQQDPGSFWVGYFWAPFSAITGVAPPPQPQCAYPQSCFRRGFEVVVEHDHWLGESVGATTHDFYRYSNPRIDLRGRGFLGFAAVDRWSPDVPTETLSFYGTGVPDAYDESTRKGGMYLGPSRPTQVWQFTPLVLEDATGAITLPAQTPTHVQVWNGNYAFHPHNGGATYTYDLTDWSSDEYEVPMKIAADAVPHVYTGTGQLPTGATEHIARKGSNSFDELGNMTDQVTQTTGGDTVETKTKMATPDLTNWIVDRPDEIDDWRYPTGSPVPAPRTTTFAFWGTTPFVRHVGVNESATDASQALMSDMTANADGLVATSKIAEKTGELPRSMSYAYDSLEGIFAIKKTNALGQSETALYHPAFGTLVATSDRNGQITQRQIDELGRLRSIIPALGVTQSLSYAPRMVGTVADGVTTSTTRSDGSGIVVEADFSDRVIRTQRAGFAGTPSVVGFAYDRLGARISESRAGYNAPSPQLRTVTLRDSYGRPIQQTVDGRTTHIGHVGLLQTELKDAGLHDRWETADSEGRLVSLIEKHDGLSLPTSFTYGDYGSLSTVTDSAGNVTSYGYDTLGRRVSSVEPDAGTSGALYNGFGETISTARGATLSPAGVVTGGAVTTYTRDALGRITRSHDADGDTLFTWDTAAYGVGKLASTTSPVNGSVVKSFTYDTSSRLVGERWNVSAAGVSVPFGFIHDALGRLTKITYPTVPGHASFAVDLTYNAHGYLSSAARDACSPACSPYWQILAADADGKVTGGKVGPVSTTRVYDANGELSQALDAGINSYIYPPRDADGEILERDENLEGRIEKFGYDDLHRVTAFSVGAMAEGYQYDDLGNLTTATHAGMPAVTYGYAGGPHRLASASGGQTFAVTYDGGVAHGRGRVTADGTRSIAYTEFDLPKAVTQVLQLHTTNGTAVTTQFQYDADHTRVFKSNTVEQQLSLAGLYEHDTNGSSSTYVYYVPSPVGLAARISIDGISQTETLEYLHHDERGSVTAVSNSAGVLESRYYFSPFGARTTTAGTPTNTASTSLGFDELPEDDDLGLIDQLGRIYNPTTRHFLTPDREVAHPDRGQSYNPYSFVMNNPIMRRDPTGFTDGDDSDNGNDNENDNENDNDSDAPIAPQAGPGETPPSVDGCSVNCTVWVFGSPRTKADTSDLSDWDLSMDAFEDRVNEYAMWARILASPFTSRFPFPSQRERTHGAMIFMATDGLGPLLEPLFDAIGEGLFGRGLEVAEGPFVPSFENGVIDAEPSASLGGSSAKLPEGAWEPKADLADVISKAQADAGGTGTGKCLDIANNISKAEGGDHIVLSGRGDFLPPFKTRFGDIWSTHTANYVGGVVIDGECGLAFDSIEAWKSYWVEDTSLVEHTIETP